MTKLQTAIKVLKTNKWVPREALVNALGETDLRTVRRLRDYGYTITVKTDNGVIKYKRS